MRAARLERGLTIEDVARQLRLSVRQVTALEEDDYSKLSSITFLRGFVRNYAKLLQMDAAPLLQRVQESLPPPQTQTISYQIEGIPFPSHRNQGKRNLIIGVMTFVALLLLVYEIYRGNEVSLEKRQADARAEAGTRTEPFSTAAPQLQSSPPAAMNDVSGTDMLPADKEDMPLAKTDTPPAKADIPPANADMPPANANVPPAKAGVPSAEGEPAFGKSERASGWGSGSSGNRKEISGATGAASFSAINRSQTRKCASTESGERWSGACGCCSGNCG